MHAFRVRDRSLHYSTGVESHASATAVIWNLHDQSVSTRHMCINHVFYYLVQEPPPARGRRVLLSSPLSKRYLYGLGWRCGIPHVIEASKKEAEDKRQRAIVYRHQPRNSSMQEKMFMTKNKLSKLAAKSGSINATMDASDQFYSASWQTARFRRSDYARKSAASSRLHLHQYRQRFLGMVHVYAPAHCCLKARQDISHTLTLYQSKYSQTPSLSKWQAML